MSAEQIMSRNLSKIIDELNYGEPRKIPFRYITRFPDVTMTSYEVVSVFERGDFCKRGLGIFNINLGGYQWVLMDDSGLYISQMQERTTFELRNEKTGKVKRITASFKVQAKLFDDGTIRFAIYGYDI